VLAHRRIRHALLTTAILVAALTLTACSGSSPDSAPAAASAPADGVNASPESLLAAAYRGVVALPPTTKAESKGGSLIWVVSCGQGVATCATPAEAAVTAAETAGFTAKLCDGQLNPQGWSACIRQGISAKAGGIIVIGQDCTSLQAALQEAKAAAIPTVGAGGNDCDVTGGEKLYTATVSDLDGMTAKQWWAKIGALQADWIIGKTAAKSQVLSLRFTDAIWGEWVQQGFEAELATCGGCKILDTLAIGNQDVAGGRLPQKFATALLKQPTANAVNVPIDGWFFAGLAQAIKSSGRTDQLAVIGAFAEKGNLDFIRSDGGEDASVGFSAAWNGWAGVDALVRLAAGQPTATAGIGLQVVDKGHNLPTTDEPFSYEPAVDFASAYQKVWGKA
jgi:ribose transport system substrate-binding protein